MKQHRSLEYRNLPCDVIVVNFSDDVVDLKLRSGECIYGMVQLFEVLRCVPEARQRPWGLVLNVHGGLPVDLPRLYPMILVPIARAICGSSGSCYVAKKMINDSVLGCA